jgi:hypothetical protein
MQYENNMVLVPGTWSSTLVNCGMGCIICEPEGRDCRGGRKSNAAPYIPHNHLSYRLWMAVSGLRAAGLLSMCMAYATLRLTSYDVSWSYVQLLKIRYVSGRKVAFNGL